MNPFYRDVLDPSLAPATYMYGLTMNDEGPSPVQLVTAFVDHEFDSSSYRSFVFLFVDPVLPMSTNPYPFTTWPATFLLATPPDVFEIQTFDDSLYALSDAESGPPDPPSPYPMYPNESENDAGLAYATGCEALANHELSESSYLSWLFRHVFGPELTPWV